MRKVAVLVCLAVFFAVPAMANPYVSVNFGLVNLTDSDFTMDIAPGERVSGKFSFDNGIAFLGAIGGEFAGDFRGEIELGYRNNDLDRLHADGGGSVSIGGDVTTISLMANIIKDFPLGTGFTPFIGAGIGMANIEAEIRFAGLSDKEDDNVFAYQFFAGGGIDLAPKVKLDLQYRFFATSDPDFNGLESEYLSHNFLAGLRFGF